MPAIKIGSETAKRINEVFESLLVGNSEISQKLAKTSASWDFKINAIIDRLQIKWTNKEDIH